jgi:agmatine deiminase
MNGIVFVPKFGIKEDDIAVKAFEKIFGKPIVQVDSSEIANDGGVLNCITWNIKK